MGPSGAASDPSSALLMARIPRSGIAVALTTIAASASVLWSKRAHDLDREVSRHLAAPRGHRTDIVAGAITDIGSVFGVTGAAATLAASGRREAALEVFGAGMTAWTLAQGLKPLARRPRPYTAEGVHRLVAEPAGLSWPSGHPAVAAAVATALSSHLPPAGRAVGAALSTAVAYSRVYVGVHYVGDVLAGLGLGVLSGVVWGWTGPVRRHYLRWPGGREG